MDHEALSALSRSIVCNIVRNIQDGVGEVKERLKVIDILSSTYRPGHDGGGQGLHTV